MSFPFSRAPFSRLAPKPSTMPCSLAISVPLAPFIRQTTTRKKGFALFFPPSSFGYVSYLLCPVRPPLTFKERRRRPRDGWDSRLHSISSLVAATVAEAADNPRSRPVPSPIGDSVLFADFIRRGEQRRAMLRTTAGRKMRSPPCIIYYREAANSSLSLMSPIARRGFKKVFMSMTIIPSCSPGSRIIGTHSRVTPSPPCSFFSVPERGRGANKLIFLFSTTFCPSVSRCFRCLLCC